MKEEAKVDTFVPFVEWCKVTEMLLLNSFNFIAGTSLEEP
jgi:hypothetical protein